MTKWRETEEGIIFGRKYEKVTKDVMTVRLSPEDWDILLEVMHKLKQPKPSTAMKFLVHIGANVLLAEPTSGIIDTIFGNVKRNERSGAIVNDPRN